jgi:hypothetical protein
MILSHFLIYVYVPILQSRSQIMLTGIGHVD